MCWVCNAHDGRKGRGTPLRELSVRDTSSAAPKFARLNSIAQLFEFEVDAEGNTRAKNTVNNSSLGGYSMYHHFSPVGSIARWR